jgi:hypothetical protein
LVSVVNTSSYSKGERGDEKRGRREKRRKRELENHLILIIHLTNELKMQQIHKHEIFLHLPLPLYIQISNINTKTNEKEMQSNQNMYPTFEQLNEEEVLSLINNSSNEMQIE